LNDFKHLTKEELEQKLTEFNRHIDAIKTNIELNKYNEKNFEIYNSSEANDTLSIALEYWESNKKKVLEVLLKDFN